MENLAHVREEDDQVMSATRDLETWLMLLSQGKEYRAPPLPLVLGGVQ